MAKVDPDRILLTQEGYDELRAEYDALVKSERPKIVASVESARSLGDLSENESYHLARRKQGFIEGRISELREILENARIVKKKDNGRVQVGSRVKVKRDGEEQEFTLVDEREAGLRSDKISHQSPIGRALIGKKLGEIVEVDAPVGKVKYKILAVR